MVALCSVIAIWLLVTAVVLGTAYYFFGWIGVGIAVIVIPVIGMFSD